ncbi:hypothetical protein CK203_083133 [Vitis vinifera]|uniref:Uncharacterized protein n=1 Tax=Vitis vinifera TaxID=29760 RepID=A0A438DWS1_VITVI|nr:hypothetical protein CK203_083133 [Vitis vinifera]
MVDSSDWTQFKTKLQIERMTVITATADGLMIALFSVAVMTRAFPNESSKQKDLVLLQNIASYMLLACGLIYVISGILCIGFLKRARQKKEVSREQAIKDLEIYGSKNGEGGVSYQELNSSQPVRKPPRTPPATTQEI